jgi:hypothetical protein
VELQIPATVLRQLAADLDALGNWAPVITDLAHQHASALRPAGDPGRYTPSAAVRRWVHVRDQRCIMIGCRAPARGTDTDHTRDAALGGTTTDDNLDAVCRHHHRVKHEGGWTLHQPEAGTFRWTSRLGHIYHRHPPAIIEPLPEPIPAYRPPYSLITPADDGWEGTQIWERIWEDTAAEPDPPPEHDPRAGPPPF